MKSKGILFLATIVIAAMMIVSVSSVSALSKDINASADTYVDGGNPFNNYGGLTYMRVDANDAPRPKGRGIMT
jgi:hypothetical protein